MKIKKYVDLVYGAFKKKPERLVRFSGRWVDSNLPFPRSSNTFFANITQSEVQILFGISNFLTDDVKALSIFSISPLKVVELRDFLTSVVEQYEAKFSSLAPPPSPTEGESSPGTLIH